MTLLVLVSIGSEEGSFDGTFSGAFIKNFGAINLPGVLDACDTASMGFSANEMGHAA